MSCNPVLFASLKVGKRDWDEDEYRSYRLFKKVVYQANQAFNSRLAIGSDHENRKLSQAASPYTVIVLSLKNCAFPIGKAQ